MSRWPSERLARGLSQTLWVAPTAVLCALLAQRENVFRVLPGFAACAVAAVLVRRARSLVAAGLCTLAVFAVSTVIVAFITEGAELADSIATHDPVLFRGAGLFAVPLLILSSAVFVGCVSVGSRWPDEAPLDAPRTQCARAMLVWACCAALGLVLSTGGFALAFIVLGTLSVFALVSVEWLDRSLLASLDRQTSSLERKNVHSRRWLLGASVAVWLLASCASRAFPARAAAPAVAVPAVLAQQWAGAEFTRMPGYPVPGVSCWRVRSGVRRYYAVDAAGALLTPEQIMARARNLSVTDRIRARLMLEEDFHKQSVQDFEVHGRRALFWCYADYAAQFSRLVRTDRNYFELDLDTGALTRSSDAGWVN